MINHLKRFLKKALYHQTDHLLRRIDFGIILKKKRIERISIELILYEEKPILELSFREKHKINWVMSKRRRFELISITIYLGYTNTKSYLLCKNNFLKGFNSIQLSIRTKSIAIFYLLFSKFNKTKPLWIFIYGIYC